MKTADVIVIGGGLAGLMAAAVASNLGQRVTVLTYGSGSLPLSSGALDFLDAKAPDVAIKALPANHPYKKIGWKNIDAAAKFFCDLTARDGLSYVGRLSAQVPIVTAVGTLKYSALAPESMNAACIFDKQKIIVAGVKGLKDFYASMLVDNLRQRLQDKSFAVVKLDLNLLGGRDVTCMDAARFLTADNAQLLVDGLKGLNVSEDAAIILPPILGLTGSETRDAVKTLLRAEIVETTCLPPSPPGIRLRRALIRYLQKKDVRLVENARVIRGVFEGKRVTGVVVKSAAREKIFSARRKIILATGGFYSGGLTLREFDAPREPIFNVPIFFPRGVEAWSNEKLFDDKPQGFATTGLLTDVALRPIDSSGNVLFDNLHVVGADLGGFDFIHEHSAGGVAIASAYHAATIQGGDDR